jgi:hypothetical protein
MFGVRQGGDPVAAYGENFMAAVTGDREAELAQ